MPSGVRVRPSPSSFRAARGLAMGVLLLGSAAGFAQTGLAPASPSAPSPAASADAVPGRLRPTARVTAPTDALRSLHLDNATPEGRVTPQLRIPLGKKGDAPVVQRRPTDTGLTSSAPSGLIGDAAARCDAERSEQLRLKCRDQLARQSPR